MLDATQEATVAGVIPDLNAQWINGYAQLGKIDSQYAIGGPDTSVQRLALDRIGPQIVTLGTVQLTSARQGDISFDQWMAMAQGIRDGINTAVGSVQDTSLLGGIAGGAAKSLGNTGTGLGVGIGLGLVVLVVALVLLK